MPRQGGWNREALECDARREECDGVTVWLEDRPLLTQVLHEEVATALIEAWVLDEAVQVTMLSEIVPMGERILLEVEGAAPAGSERAFRALLELASRTDLPAPGARLIPAWGREPLLHLGHTWRECTAVWGSLAPGGTAMRCWTR